VALMKKYIFLTVITLLLSAGLLSAKEKVKKKKRLGKIKIDYLQRKKPPVIFQHGKHSVDYEISCDECHHKNMAKMACSTCHLPREDSEVGEDLIAPKALYNEKGLKNIFHDLCKGCHKNNYRGPTKCTACHVRPKR